MARLPYPDYHTTHGSPAHSTLNVVKILSHSPATVDHWANIGNAQFKSLALSKRDRELVILLTTAKFHSGYEWTHHLPLSAKQGVSPEQQGELEKGGARKGYFSRSSIEATEGVFSARDKVLLGFLEAVIEQGVVSDEVWGETRRWFSDREIVEIISLQGFYYTFSRLTTVLDVELDSFAKAKL